MACFDLDEQTSVFESSYDLPDYNVFDWQSAEVAQVVNYFSRNGVTRTQLSQQSYGKLLVRQVLRQHRVFLVLEAILFLFIVITLMTLIIN